MRCTRTVPQIEEITTIRIATVEEVLAVHRAPYLELLDRIVRTKAPSAVESAPTYVTHSSYADAFQVRPLDLLPCIRIIPLLLQHQLKALCDKSSHCFCRGLGPKLSESDMCREPSRETPLFLSGLGG